MDIDQGHPYHSLSIEETLKKLSSDEKGLSADESKKMQEKYGKNKLPAKRGTHPLKLFFKQFKDFLILILFIAAAIAFLADKMTDVYIILFVIVFNAVMGFVRNIKRKKPYMLLWDWKRRRPKYCVMEKKKKFLPKR
ncbi:cation-transporting P-type ATPase [Negadavirga shengliensis]|uniref:Cation-transporting P-type ATPase n=1 Tax=Negadavirga shengliensis TaxID=1389218 RepID=A0ABV9TAQ6_9BACT